MKKASLFALFSFALCIIATPAYATGVTVVRSRIVTPFVPVVQTVVAAPVAVAPVVQQVAQPVQVQHVQQVQTVQHVQAVQAVQVQAVAVAVAPVVSAFAVHSPLAVVSGHGFGVQAVRFGGGVAVRQRVVIRR